MTEIWSVHDDVRSRALIDAGAYDDCAEFGDTSTPAEPAVADDLIENRQNRA